MSLNKIQKSSLNPTLLLEPLSLIIPTGTNSTYDLDLNASYNYRILQVDYVCTSGTIDFKLTIEGVDVVFNDVPSGTETVIGMSSTGASRLSNSAMDAMLGDNLKIVFTNNSTAVGISIKIHAQRI